MNIEQPQEIASSAKHNYFDFDYVAPSASNNTASTPQGQNSNGSPSSQKPFQFGSGGSSGDSATQVPFPSMNSDDTDSFEETKDFNKGFFCSGSGPEDMDTAHTEQLMNFGVFDNIKKLRMEDNSWSG